MKVWLRFKVRWLWWFIRRWCAWASLIRKKRAGSPYILTSAEKRFFRIMGDEPGRETLMKVWTISLVAEVGARVDVKARSFSEAAAKAKDLFVDGYDSGDVYNFPYAQSLRLTGVGNGSEHA